MRRPLTALLAAPLLLLGACSGDADVVEVSAPTETAAGEAEADDDGATETAAPAPGDDTTATTAPPAAGATEGDTAAGTADAADDGEVEGGAEGQAAADRAKEFLLALVDADPAACDLMLSFTDTTRPMRDVDEDLELCRQQLPDTMAGAVEAQGLGEEGRSILEAMQITGADVDGDTAVIDQDNYSELFAESMGGSSITLVKVDDEWFVDVDRFLQAP